MTLDTLTVAGWIVSRRHRRNTERGHRHNDDTILRWPAQLRATPIADELTTPDPAVNAVNTGEAL